MPRDDFERIIPAVAEEPAPELHRIEHALVPAQALGLQVGPVWAEVAQAAEPDIRPHIRAGASSGFRRDPAGDVPAARL